VTTLDPLLAQGIAAAKAGDKSRARRLLSQAVQRNPDSETAWLWLSGVLDTPPGRAFCLRKVLALNPNNPAARRGLAALAGATPAAVLVSPPPAPRPAPIITPPVAMPAPGQPPARPAVAPSSLGRQKRFWQLVIAGLGIIAVALVGLLSYALLNGATASGDELVAAAALPPSPTVGPHGTLRPTYTATPTDTPTPTPTSTPTPTHTPTPTPTDTDTPTPTPTDTPRPRRRPPTATSTPTPTPRPTLPPRVWDPRLTELGVRIEPAFVGQGQPYWRLVEARWSNERESAGKHSIYVEVLNAQGARAVGQMVVMQWVDGSVALPVEDRPPPDWPVNFGMYNTLGSYAVSVSGAPSDRVVGMGLGTADAPAFTIHTCFYLTFRLVNR
jgi:hypothetical protein